MKLEIRTDLRPGDLGAIVHLHGVTYGREQGWDATFEEYVVAPLAGFVTRAAPRERIWVAGYDGALAGCIAFVEASPGMAQIRWFLVAPACRGAGLGRRLLREAVSFCHQSGYSGIVLWTERSLTVAGQLYRA